MSSPRYAAALALAALIALPATSHAGPPWISVELPANPHDRATRDAFLTVRTYRHASAMSARLTGHAIGIVDGRRRTVALEFAPTSTTGVTAVRRTWPEQGVWVLKISLEGEDATALVAVRNGTVRSVDVPSTRQRDGWVVPRAVTDAEVEALLTRAMADGSPAESHMLVLGAAALLLIPAVAWRRRRN